MTIKYVISGTFDPLHAAHLGIAEYLERECDVPSEDIFFELSSSHCDKQRFSLKYEDRIRQFAHIGRQCISTPWATFSEKIFGFKNFTFSSFSLLSANTIEWKDERVVFCMGEDTFRRFLSRESYFGSDYERDRAIAKFRELDGTVLVLPRGKSTMVRQNGRWQFSKMETDRFNKIVGGNMNRFVQYVSETYIASNLSSSKLRFNKIGAESK